MRKLMLDLETLEVETFAVADPRHEARGTVLGADSYPTSPFNCVSFTCGDSQVRACQA
ncbi:MAG TPA: hypothetical protein VLK84_13670 [Longimicrobium sp.]|nr:hypothetical protein [Longimicrobium sp.]